MLELLEHLGEPLDHRVGGLGARLVRASPGLSTCVVGQRVGDVAGERELLDALRQRGVRRRLDGAGRPSSAGCGQPA